MVKTELLEYTMEGIVKGGNDMKFTKMQGIGNDYVYINCFEETVKNPSKLSIQISDRHFGVGSDGLILIQPSQVADCCMDMYNADGSRAEMCGNGIRCVAKYVYDHKIVKKEQIKVETLDGIKEIHLTVENGKAISATVNMGQPELRPEKIPVCFMGEQVISEPILVNGREYKITCVSMGNPHAVLYMEDIDCLDLEKIGPIFEHYEKFPKRINTEFIQVIDRKHLKMRVWERGSGETLACGTGACASAVATMLNGKADRVVDMELKGGHLTIEWSLKDNCVYMTGAAEEVYNGELNDETFKEE